MITSLLVNARPSSVENCLTVYYGYLSLHGKLMCSISLYCGLTAIIASITHVFYVRTGKGF